MQNNDNTRKLYDALTADNYKLGDFETFASDISKSGNLRKLYDAMVADNYKLGDFETFSSRLGNAPQDNGTQQPKVQPVVDAYGMPMQPEVSTIEDAPKIPQVNMDEFTVNETYLNNVADNEGAQAPMEGVEIKENLKSNLFKPQSTETPSLLDMGAKPKDYFAEAMGRRLPEAMEERRRKDFAMLSGLAENRKNWTPSSARRYRATSVDQTWYDPYAVVPEEYKALATQKWGKEGSEDAYFSAWMNLSPEEREAFVRREHIKSFFNEETANRMQGIRERALEEKGRGIAKSAMSPMGYNNSAEAAMDRMVQDASNVGTQTLKALDKAEEIKQAYKNHQLDENFFAGAYKGMKDGLTDIDNWTGLYMVGEMTNLYDIADKMEKGEALTQTEEDFLDAQAYKLAVEAALADDLGWGYGSGNVTGASIPFMLQMLASPIGGASGKAIDKGFAAVGRRAIDKFGKGILKKLLTKAPVKKVVKGLAGTVGKGIGQTILFGSDRVAAGTMERHLGNEMVAERANEEFNAGVQGKASEDLGTALFKAGVSTSMENISEFAGGAFIDDFTKMAGKKIAKEFTDAMGGSVGSRLMRAAANTRAGKALQNLANAKIFTHGANLAKSIERGTQWDGLLNEYLEEVLNNASNVMIGDMTMEDFTSLKKNAETVLGLAWTSGFFMASNAGSRIKNYVKGSSALKQTERAARQVFEGEQEKWDAYTQALSQTNGYEEAEALYTNFMDEIAQEQDKELARARMNEATAYMVSYVQMMGMNASTEEAEKEEEKTPAQQDMETALGEGLASAGTAQELDIVDEMEESALQLSERLQGMDPAQWLLQFGETPEVQLQAIRGSELDEQTKAVAETYLASAQRYEGVLLANQEEIDAKVEEAARDFDANVNQELGSVIEVLTPETKDTEGKRAYVVQGNPEEAGTITLRYEDGTTEQTTRAKIAKIVSNKNAEAIRPAVIEGVRRTAVAEVAGRMNEHVPNAAETAMFAGHNVVVDGQPGVVADMNQDGTLKVQMQDGKTISAAPQQVMDAQAYNNIMERKARAREGVMYSMPVREEAEAPAAEMAVAEAPVPVEEPTEAQKLLQEYMDESVPLEDRMTIVENNVAQARQTAMEAQAEVDAMTENKPKAQDYTNIAAYKQALAEWQVQMQDKQQVLDLARQQEATWSEVQKGMVQPMETATEQTSTKAVNEYMVSDEVDENGRAFVYSPNGSIEFGVIGADTGLTPAPILLSEGMITNPSTNDGYGLVHIEARHGDQIRAAGYKSVIEFVNEVAKNYEVIREGRDRNGHQTYMLQLTDKHNNTLMVELSGDGTYWNINTAGIFKTSYGRNRKEVYHRHTTEKQSTETAGVSQGIEQSGTQMPSSMNTPTSSASKDTQSVSAKQTDKKEISGKSVESNVEMAKAEAKNHNSKHDIEALAKEIGSSKNRIQRVIDLANNIGVKLNFANVTRTQGNAGALTNADNMASKREITLSKYMLAKGLPIEWVIGHELTHQIKADGNAENWEAYKQAIKGLVGENTFDALVAQQAEVYRKAGAYKNMPADAFMDAMEEEVCADTAGSVFLNPSNISKVMGIPQSLASRIWNALKNMVGLGTPKSVLQAVDAWQMLAEGKELTGEADGRERHSIVGTTGARALDKAEGTTVRMDNMDVAEEMEAAGKDAETIWMATGWERGADGKWKYEVLEDFAYEEPKAKAERLQEEYQQVQNEKENIYRYLNRFPARGLTEQQKAIKKEQNARLKKLIRQGEQLQDEIIESRFDTTLGELIGTDNNIIKAYPELASMPVSFVENSRFMDAGLKGAFDGEGIWINPTLENTAPTLLHEVQHAIQRIEGFARGGNTGSVKTKADALREDVRPLHEMMLDTPEWAERKRLQNRWFDETDEAEIAKIEQRVNEINESGVLDAIQSKRKQLQEKYGSDATVGKILGSPYAEDAEIWEQLPESFNDKYEAYRNLAGEAEARNVSARLNMSEEERRQTRPGKTEDVAREEQTVRYSIPTQKPIGRSLAADEAEILITDMKENADITPELEFSIENWLSEFGKDGLVTTPIGKVKMGENQIAKLLNKNREKRFGLIRPTLQTPDVIIEKHAPAEGAERESKFLFIKTFVKPDGSRFIHFESVTVLKDGMDVSISSHEIGDKALRKEMQNGTILHLNSKLSSGFDKYLTKTPTERPDLAPTSDNRLVISSSLGGGVSPISHADDAAPAISLQSRNDDELSASKDTQSVSAKQTDKKEISGKSVESNVEMTNEEVMHSISPIEGYTYSEVIDMVQNDVENILSEEGADNVEAVEFWAHGSRMRGNAKEDSDLDVVMFYKGNEKEDSLFNLINEHELAIEGIKVDVNPIRISNEQDIARYKEKSARYDQEMRFSLAGLHNISEEKLKKAIKQGGLANPSVAVIDLDTRDHNTYGDITLVLPSYMIDKKQGRNAGTYMGDAWTPTYPRVSMRLDNKGWRKIDEFIASISDDAHMRSNMHYAVEDFMQGGTTPYMQYAFLKTKGIEIPFVYKNNDRYISNEEFKELIGMDALTAFSGSIDAYNKFKELPKEVQDELYIWIINRGDKAKIKAMKESIQKDQRYANLLDYEVPFSKFNMFANDTFRREQDNGKIDYTKTFSEANNYVATNGLGAEYNAWISNLLEEAGAEEYIFAGFTPSGNAKYLPHTLENVSKVMKKDGKSNAYNNTGYGPTRAGIIKALSTLGQIRKNSETLRTDINTVDETKEELTDRLYELRSKLADMRKLSDNPFINGDYAESRLQEALSRKNPVRYLNEEYGYNIEEDGDFAKKLESFIDDVRKAPVRYFETKFERPVMLDEFHAAVIPNDTDTEVVKALEKAGLNVETYERGNDAERKEALLRASDEQVRFSLSADILAANERFNEELDEFKAKTHKGLLHLGKPGAILRTIGVDADEMTLSPSVLSRHLKKHNLTADDLIGLPLSIQTPILVYRHGDKNPNLVVVTEMDVKGGKLSVSLELDENGHVVEIDNIRSVHSKDATKEMARLGAMREGELKKALRWVEKKEVQDWLGIADLNRPIHTINPELSSVANVLLSFQNPPILEDESSQNDANATPGVQKYSLPARPAIPRRNEGEGIMEYAQRVAKATEAQKAWDVANKTAMDIDRQIKNSEEYRDILAQKEPQTIEEAASVALAGGKLLWNDHVDGTKVSKGAKSMMGWGEGERQKFFAMFASKENGGVSVEQMGEAVMEICNQYNIPVDETDAMAGTNAVLEVLQSAQRPSDITGYIEHNRIEQVRRMIEEEQEMHSGERNRAYMDMYGMTYDDFVEIASTIDTEDEQERSDDKNVIAWLYGQSQRQQERITNAKAELKQMEKFGVSKAKYDAAYRTMERLEAKVKQTQEMLDEVTKELRTAKGQATRQRKANMRYKAKKSQWKLVYDKLRNAINGKNIRSVDKSTLTDIMRAVGSADLTGIERIFGEAGAIEDIILGVNMRATQDRIDKLLATKTTALNDKGIATGKSVDASVQAILANIRKTLEGILHHDIENRIHDLRSRNWHIRHNAPGGLSQEQQAEVDANNAKIAELKAELDRELATNTANTEQAVNEQIEKLTEQIDKKIRTEEESAELMTTLALKRQMVAIHTSYQDTATVEALLRRKLSEVRKLSELRTNWVALHDGNIPKDKRAEYRQKRKALQEQIAGLEAQVREGRQATLDAMQSFADSLEETITTGRANLKSKVQEQLQRRKEFVAKAVHDVNASGKQMQSVNEADKQENDKLPWYKRMFSPALRTFDYMLQKIATRTYGKDSWLYRQFMLGENGVMAAHDEYLRGMQTAARTLEDKAKEIFGKSYQDVMADSNRKKDIGIEILRDAEDYEPSYIPLKLTKGQATYIYMLWRMRDGFSKLATQGFTEEIMQRIEEYIGPDYIQWADWMQMEYLPMMREKYNARYREIYDTNMAAIDNYVPIRIHGQAIRKEVDLTDATASMPGMQKKNGALIQRTVNVNPIDISNNIFELIGQHIDEMEEFYAYAPVRRDLQYILSSPAFRNILNANEPGTFQSLLEAARIATKTNQQPESAALKAFNDFMNKTQKGLVSGNIAYRNMTAIKQVLSAPAFIGYSQSPEYLGILAKNMLGGYLRNLPTMAFPLIPGIGHWAQKMTVEETAKGMPYIDKFLGETFRWCMREFPDFRERVTRGSAGDIRLEEKGFSELLDKYTEIGMSANVFIDAVTVSIGLKSIYDYEMKKAEKRIQKMAKEMQMDKQWAEEEMRKASNAAKIQATLFANQTQQSSNPALLSPMQVSKNFLERSLTLYKNSSLGLMRAGIGGMRNLLRYMKGEEARRRMTEEYTRMFMQEGFAENEAKKRAISYISSEARKGAFVALLEGFAMNVIWNLGSKGLLGFMAGGGDDDNKERTTGEMVWDGTKFVINNTFGSAIPFVNDALEGRLPAIGLTTSEAEKAWKDIKKQLDENGISLAFALTGMRYAAKFGGVDMQVWANTMDGYYRLFSETGNSDDNILALMLILNSPHSNRMAVARELYKGKSEEEFKRAIELAGRYSQPVWAFGREMTDKVESDMVKWYLSDNATDEEKRRKHFVEDIKEQIDNLKTVEDALEMFDEVSDTELRKKISSKIDQLSKPEETFAEKVDRKKENALAEDDTDMGGYTYMKMSDSQDLLEEKRMRATIDMLRPIAERQKELFEEYGSQSAVYTRFMAEHGAEIRRYKTLKAYSKAIQMRKRKMDEEGADVQALYEDIKELYKDARNI